MAKPGSKPLPTKIKMLRGGRKTYHRAMPKNEPKPRKYKRRPAIPSEIKDNKLARNEWVRVAGDLGEAGLFTIIDRAALMGYCVCYATWVDATRQIQKHGVLVKAQNGFPMQSPYLSIANKAQGEMRKWLVEFGMTPSSRSRVTADKPQEETDPLAEFMRKGWLKGMNKDKGAKG